MKNSEASDVQRIIETKNAYYYGTTKGKSWWRRYTKDGWLARGNSELWIDEEGIHFRRYITKDTKHILFSDITEIETGKSHAGKWAFIPVIKISWKKEDMIVVSGFSVSNRKDEAEKWIRVIEDMKNKYRN